MVSIAASLIGLALLLLTACNSDVPVAATADIPASGLRVTIVRVATHPFLARYNLKLWVEGPGRCAASSDLFPDTGGVSRRNLYQGASGAFYLLGQFDVRVVETAGCAIRLVEFRELEKDLTFLGTFDADEQRGWTFLPAPVRPEKPFEKL